MTLSPRDAKLRADALKAIGDVGKNLSSPYYIWNAFQAILYNHPRAALQRISRAEGHLRDAKRCLRIWAARMEARGQR